MGERVSARTIISVLLVWTVGVLTLWVIANPVLNEGVSDADVRECVDEGFIPADECRETLEELEAEEGPLIGVGLTLVVWVAGVVTLAWLLRPPGPTG